MLLNHKGKGGVGADKKYDINLNEFLRVCVV
jgi:hypothetical protein